MRERTFWLDHVLNRANQYNVSGSGTVKTITPYGSVIQEGTPQDAKHFNSMEESLSALELALLLTIMRLGNDEDETSESIRALRNDVTEIIDESLVSIREEVEGVQDAIEAAVGDITKIKSVETGQKVLTNSLAFPFNNSKATVALSTARENVNYIVIAEVISAAGNVGEVVVSDRLTNGFKLEYTGSAKSATISYKVIGGWA